MKNLIAKILYLPFIVWTSVVTIFSDDSTRSTNFAKPTIYQTGIFELSNLSRNKIRSVQKKLIRKGLLVGIINSKLNYQTKLVIENFKQEIEFLSKR